MPRIIVDFDDVTGSIKALHGVNNGPVCYGSVVDVTESYREMGIPLVRLHDPNWPHPREVDIYTIFPDFSKDADDPASYDFIRTDEYIRTVLATGADIVYRLGVSIEHTARKWYIHPPEDFGKWADVCVHIIDHYTRGWADGFEYGIRYWEIWNEPDGAPMWTGTKEQYFDLYRTASLAIREKCPHVKVGGCACTSAGNDFNRDFIRYVAENSLPLDFMSWHTYDDDPQRVLGNITIARRLLDDNGLVGTESHMNEWNYFHCPEGWDAFWKDAHIKRRVHLAQKDESGASFASVVLLEAQDLPLDAANYYDGQPVATFCGLFDQYGVEQKTCFAFKAFNTLATLGNKVRVEGHSPVSCCAAKTPDGSGYAIMLANFDKGDQVCNIICTGIDTRMSWEIRRIDAENDYTPQPLELVDGRTDFTMPSHSVVLISVSGRMKG